MGAVDPQIIEYSPHEMERLRHEGLLRLFQDTDNDLLAVLGLPHLMGSERNKLIDAKEIVLELLRLEEEK